MIADILTREEIEYCRSHATSRKHLVYDMALAYLDTLADSKTPQGWQPIETAPKDVAILVCGGFYCAGDYRGEHTGVALVHWHGDMWEISEEQNFYIYIDNPTHWQPLPSPPTLSAKDNKNEQ